MDPKILSLQRRISAFYRSTLFFGKGCGRVSKGERMKMISAAPCLGYLSVSCFWTLTRGLLDHAVGINDPYDAVIIRIILKSIA